MRRALRKRRVFDFVPSYLNFRTNEVQIGDDPPWIARVDSGSCTSATDEPEVELNFSLGKQARHALRKGEQGFLAWVSANQKTTLSNSDFIRPLTQRQILVPKKDRNYWPCCRSFRTSFHQTYPRSYHRNERSTMTLISSLDHLLRLDLRTGYLSPVGWTWGSN